MCADCSRCRWVHRAAALPSQRSSTTTSLRISFALSLERQAVDGFCGWPRPTSTRKKRSSGTWVPLPCAAASRLANYSGTSWWPRRAFRVCSSPYSSTFNKAGRLYDEMHVDGNASASLFIAPAAAYFALLDQRSLDGAQVYVLINGQIIDAPETTPFKLRPIVARTFSVALKHMSRAQVVAVDQFAEKYRMSVQSTYLPFDYPKYSSADFRASTMRPLFEYGARCAQSGRLWTTMDETMDTVASRRTGLEANPRWIRK